MSIKSKLEFIVEKDLNLHNQSFVCESGIEFSYFFIETIDSYIFKLNIIKGDFRITNVNANGKKYFCDAITQTFRIDKWLINDEMSIYAEMNKTQIKCQFFISANIEYLKKSYPSNFVLTRYCLWIPSEILKASEYYENSFNLPGYEIMTFKYFIFKNDCHTKVLIENPHMVEICGKRENFERILTTNENVTIDLSFAFDPTTFQSKISEDEQNAVLEESRPVSTLPKPIKSSIMYEVMANSKYFDVILISSDKIETQTHRCVLDKFSKTFSEMLADSTGPIPIKININEFDAETIQASLDFLYDKTDSILGKERKIFQFAYGYDIDDACCLHFEKTVNVENVCEFIQIAYENGFEELKQKCRKFIASKKKEIDPLKIMELPKEIIVDVFYV
uniref:BTB domain-containing protein n=1 Tax=Panagrolaimus sp. PS1159 TaxID=55785 RepID=A0AC35GGY0_9BILA